MLRGYGRGEGRGRWRGGRGRGRGRGRGQGRRNLDRDAPDFSVLLSKRMSHLLRHGAVEAGLGDAMDAAGFLPLTDVLSLPRFAGITEADINTLVANCPKGRFELKDDSFGNAADDETRAGTCNEMRNTKATTVETGNETEAANTVCKIGGKKIRATQGHTMRHPVLDDEAMLTRLDEESVGTFLIREAAHGTTLSAFEAIKNQGLSVMRRRHVHLSRSVPVKGRETVSETVSSGDGGVCKNQASGFRGDATVAVWVDVARGVREGVPFFISHNDVVLSPGEGDTGVVPIRLLLRAELIKTGEALEL
jgi:RNA:NAD 2'-phosphotransferase (TPT1/KptA family)